MVQKSIMLHQFKKIMHLFWKRITNIMNKINNILPKNIIVKNTIYRMLRNVSIQL